MARRGYPPEFRRRVVDLVEGGRKVSEVGRKLRARNDMAQRTNLMLVNETDPEAVSDLVRGIKEAGSE